MKVLIVDDEELELNMLEHAINWEKLGINQVRKASNGKRAYYMMKEEMPDILITDIEMPVMDGFALARRVIAEKMPVKIIFLTGYDSFSYIKVAFQVDAVDYILKPIVPLQMESVLRRTMELIEKDKGVHQALEVSKKVCLENRLLGRRMDMLPFVFEAEADQAFRLAVVKARWSRTLYEALYQAVPELRYGAYGSDSCWFLIPEDRDPKAVLRKIMDYGKAQGACSGNAGYSAGTFLLRELLAGAEDVWTEQEVSFWNDWLYSGELDSIICLDRSCIHGISVQKPEKQEEGNAEKNAGDICLTGAFTDMKREEAEAEILGVGERLWAELGQPKAFADALCRILSETDRYYVDKNPQIAPFIAMGCREAGERICRANHKETAKRVFLEYCMQIFSYMEAQGQGKHAYVVIQVKEYVAAHYGERLDMEDLSRRLSLSVSYIRKIFKAETGQNLVDYIADYRFEKALELLKDKNKKICEVSSSVGIENVSYFNTVFSRRYGMTPGEYRKTL